MSSSNFFICWLYIAFDLMDFEFCEAYISKDGKILLFGFKNRLNIGLNELVFFEIMNPFTRIYVTLTPIVQEF